MQRGIVWVVDDDSSIRWVLERALAGAGLTMADWVTGKVTKVQNWTDALFSLTVHAPINPFTAGQFTKLGL
ncbi:hypothetical protein MJI47_30450, partial [Salmonella enterica subsp. enterica serovar Kentucky]|nr:hypothetical protein [Salmonella enterica subsp. enterica serovar Kentucky]